MKFKPGQRVRVINTGQSYTSYDQMAHWLGLKNYQQECVENNKVYIVIGSEYHSRRPEGEIVVGVTDNGKDFLVGEKGLEFFSNFREGDIVRCGSKVIKVDTYSSMDIDDSAILVSRKQLI